MLDRREDPTGTSGTGIVAEGVVWADGEVVIHWLSETPTTAMHKDLSSVVRLHGHDGRTLVRWT